MEVTAMGQPCRPLKDVLAEIADPRQARGKRHSLVALLALVCVATLCGYRSYSAMAEWGRHYGREVLRALGFTHPTPPCAATLHRVLRRLDRVAVQAALGRWAEEALAATPPVPPQEEALALDGKTLRGSRKQGAPGAHLLSALAHRLGLTVAHEAVDDKTNEIGAVQAVLENLILAGRVVTVDALLTQRAVAQAIVDGGGDYVMVAKDNQPHLRQDIAAVLATPPQLAAPVRTAQTVDKGHGRIERRHLTARALLPGDCDWPGAQQVFRVERRVIRTKTGEVHTEVLEGLTSRAAEGADPQRVLGFLRDHWRIENQSHWVRDVTFEEDRSQVRCGAIPEVMAAFRTTAIGLLRAAGETNIAAACRRCAAQPWRALALIGIGRE
jgi:predicted transposase YbfD/YdcC